MVERLKVELRRLTDGANDLVEALVRPDRSAFEGNARKLQHHRLELSFLLGELAFERRRTSAGLFRLPSELRFLCRRRILELCADGISFRPQPVDLGLARANLRV